MKLLYAIFICHLVQQIVECDPIQITSPIIIVPGLGGSTIEYGYDKDTFVSDNGCGLQEEWSTLWANQDLITLNPPCWAEAFSLIYDSATKTTSDYPGVRTRVVGFGNASSVKNVDLEPSQYGQYFGPLYDHLVSRGYEDGVSLRGAPYDFRKAPNELTEFFENLKNLVEETYEINGKKKVIILGHGMGCLYTLYFLNTQTQAWIDEYISSFISTSGPYGGFVASLGAIFTGASLGNPNISRMNTRDPLRAMPSGDFLIPYDTFWSTDEVLVYGPNNINYTVNDYEALFNDANFPVGFDMWKVIEPLTKNLDPPGVQVYCIYGSSLNTIESLVYTDWDSIPGVFFGDGDGRVNIRSLQGCQRLNQGLFAIVPNFELQGAEDINILSDPGYIAYIDSILDNSG